MQEVLEEMRAEVNNMDWSVDGKQSFSTVAAIIALSVGSIIY